MKKLFVLGVLAAFLSSAQAAEVTPSSEEELEKAMAAAAMAMLSQNEEFQKKFAEMQEKLPLTLDLAKEYRSCLQGADDKSAAADCQKKAQKKAVALGLEDDELDEDLNLDLKEWTAAEKTEYLKELDESIQFMSEALPCLQAAKTPVEIIKCPGFAEGE